MLENLGWTFHRIWSTDWFFRREEEIERAWNAYQLAIRNANEHGKAPQSSESDGYEEVLYDDGLVQGAGRSVPTPPFQGEPISVNTPQES